MEPRESLSVKTTTEPKGSPPPQSKIEFRHREVFLRFAKAGIDDVLSRLESHTNGLTTEEVDHRLLLYGFNEISQEHYSWQRQLLKTFVNPFILLLAALAIVSYLTDDIKGATVMGAMVTISVVLTFFQEFRSSRAAERLQNMVSTNATVIRRTGFIQRTADDPQEWLSQKQEVQIRTIVPGDIVFLSAGDMIPGDVRLINAKDLHVSQSALTGESIPIEKSSAPETVHATHVLETKNLCFMGTNVVSGTATAIVLKTGKDTFLGSIASALTATRPPTAFDLGIRKFTWLMLRFMMVMVPLVFLINGLTKGNWVEAFTFAIAVAVGLTPEMLPMIVTVNLAKGALAMSKKKVIVKRLNSIQNFGAMDVLCTDKTGTLTQDKVVLEKYVDVLGAENPRVLKYAYLNSHYQTSLKNLLDIAILKHVDVPQELGIRDNYRKIDEIPFDFNRRRMSVVVEKQGSRHILICKGALEEMLKVCSFAEMGRKLVPMRDVPTGQVYEAAQKLNDDGLRVIAVGYKDVPAENRAYSIQDEAELVLLGYVAFLDPPKETATKAIRALEQFGVQVKVLTGDNDRVTRKICHEVGIDADRIVLGSDMEEFSDRKLDETIEHCSVFAKLSPAHKERIVRALKRKNHVVGFMGDGINDSPALRAADVGISVDNAVDIAKESADIILLEKSLLILEEGVVEGRKVFANIIKYIKMGASSNFGNVFSVLGSSALLPFLPMQPVQLLTQNLLYDLSQTTIPFDHVDPEYIQKPRRWEITEIAKYMLFMGPISSFFDYATFALMWFVFKTHSPAHAGLFQSGWFVEGLLSQTLIVHMIRTQKIPFIQSRASAPLLLATAAVMAIGIALPFTGFGRSIGLTALPISYFPWLVGFLVLYCIITQFAKQRFTNRRDLSPFKLSDR